MDTNWHIFPKVKVAVFIYTRYTIGFPCIHDSYDVKEKNS